MHKRFFGPLMGVLAAALLFSANAGAFDEGIDYKTLSQPQATETGDKIEVLELFWYGCPHCYHLEPKLKSWLEAKPDYVEFRRMPVVVDGKVAGLVSIGDVVKALKSATEYEVRQLQSYITGAYG